MPIPWNRGEHGCPDVAWYLIESLPANSEISAHSRITNEIGGMTWVAYVISSKPPFRDRAVMNARDRAT